MSCGESVTDRAVIEGAGCARMLTVVRRWEAHCCIYIFVHITLESAVPHTVGHDVLKPMFLSQLRLPGAKIVNNGLMPLKKSQ